MAPRARAVVKICGVTTPEDARLAVACGASYVGLNFYPESPRHLSRERAREVRDAVEGDAKVVGVFVNAEPEVVRRTAKEVGLDLLQFHGEEELDEIAEFAGRGIRALRPRGPVENSELERLATFWGVLFDAPHESLYGGTGQSWDYSRALEAVSTQRVFSAGGVRPANVRKVLESLPGVFAVDVCSGVESSPGRKDPRLLGDLFREVERYRSPE